MPPDRRGLWTESTESLRVEGVAVMTEHPTRATPDSRTTPPRSGTPDDVVRDVYRAFELRDLSRLGSLLETHVTWMPPVDRVTSRQSTAPGGRPTMVDAPAAGPSTPGRAGVIVGRERVLDHFEALVESTGGRCHWRLQFLYAHPAGRVVAMHEVVTDGIEVANECLLFEIAGGKVGRIVPLSPVRSTSA